jgi:hypothetical protein
VLRYIGKLMAFAWFIPDSTLSEKFREEEYYKLFTDPNPYDSTIDPSLCNPF